MVKMNDLRDLLPVKTLVSSRPVDIRVAISGCGRTSSAHRLRITMGAPDFNQYFYRAERDGINPRSDVHGSASEGMILTLTAHGANKLRFQSNTYSYFFANSRHVNAVESPVSNQHVRAVVAEYADGSRYLLIEPLSNAFLTATSRKARDGDKSWAPLRAIREAFERAGLPFSGYRHPPALAAPESPNRIHAEFGPLTPVPEPKAEQSVNAEVESHQVIHTGVAVVSDFSELKAALDIANEARRALTERGQAVELFISDTGEIKARARVVIDYEL